MSKILVTGASSLMAKYFIRTKPEGVDVVCSYRSYCPNPAFWMDITDKDRIKYALDVLNPDVIFHVAAIGDVDVAENNKELVKRVELMGTKALIELSRAKNIKFVYMSSNAVFDGENAPYKEDSERRPINEYGKIKVEAENAVMEHPDWLIIRPILLYGWPYSNSRSNFVTRTIQSLSEGKEIKVVNDTVTQPTYAQDFCEAVWKLLGIGHRIIEIISNDNKVPPIRKRYDYKEQKNQIFHVASEEKDTLYGLTLKIAHTWDFDVLPVKNGREEDLIKPVPSDYFPSIAPRPKDTTYDLTKLHNLGIKCRGIVEGLTAMKEEK